MLAEHSKFAVSKCDRVTAGTIVPSYVSQTKTDELVRRRIKGGGVVSVGPYQANQDLHQAFCTKHPLYDHKIALVPDTTCTMVGNRV